MYKHRGFLIIRTCIRYKYGIKDYRLDVLSILTLFQ